MAHRVNIQDHNHQGLVIREIMATVMQGLRVVLLAHNPQAGHLQVVLIKEVQAPLQAIRHEAVQRTLHLQEAAVQAQLTQHRPEAVQVVLRDLTQVAVEAAAEAVVIAVAVEAADAKDQRLSKIISIKINNFDHETYPDYVGGGFTVIT